MNTTLARSRRSLLLATLFVSAAFPALVTLASAAPGDRDNDGVPDAVDIRPDLPAGVLFDQPVPPIYPNATYLTCLIGIFDEPAVHNWKIRLRSTATETVSLDLVATTVNASEVGSIRASVLDASGTTKILDLTYPATEGTSALGSLPLLLQGGVVYNVRVEIIGPPSAPLPAPLPGPMPAPSPGPLPAPSPTPSPTMLPRHYDIGASDRRLEIAWQDPLRYLEHEHQAWAVLADAHESVKIEFFTDSPPMGANQATELSAKVILADGTVVVPATNLALPAALVVPAASSPRGLVVVVEHADGHFRMRRSNNGGDLGFYVLPCPPHNHPPMARVQNVTVFTGPNATNCSAPASIDNGSSDPDGDAITITQSPPGPYTTGTTMVTLTVTDSHGATSSATAVVTVIDNTAPHADCIPTTNPSGAKVPTAGENPKSGQNPDGFYQLSGGDNCDGAGIAIYIKDSASDFVAGPFSPGDKVKITQAPGVTPNQKKMAGVVVAHIQLKGDALVYGVDSAGNQGEPHLCLVPPLPK